MLHNVAWQLVAGSALAETISKRWAYLVIRTAFPRCSQAADQQDSSSA